MDLVTMSNAPLGDLTPRPLRAVTGPVAYSEISAEMEAEAVYHSLTNVEFWGAVGRHIECEALRTDQAKLLMQAAALVSADGVPVTPTAVVDRLQRRVHSREIAAELVGQAEQWLDTIEDGALAGTAACVVSLSPVLRQRARTAVVQELARRNAVDGNADVGDLVELLHASERIGAQSTTTLKGLDGGVWALFEHLAHAERLPTGCLELDESMDGGVPRGTITTIGGDPGDGKSVCLEDMCTHNLRLGVKSVYVTMEMGAAQTLLRFVANLTDTPMEAVARGDRVAKARFTRIIENNLIAPFAIIELPQGSRVPDLMAELKVLRQEDPRFEDGWDALYVDYGDLMSGRKNDPNTYYEMKTVWEGLRGIARTPPANWVITASQLKDKSERDGGPNDLSDSKYKGRTSDCVLLIGRDAEDATVRTLQVAKYRDGQSGQLVGPVVPDFPRGRFFGSHVTV